MLPLIPLLLSFSIASASGGPFDYLMFTAIYPTAVCRADDDTVPESCEIPSGTPTWTVHGLWPNFENGSYPQFCPGNPKHFDEKLIKPIEEEMRRSWPNLYPTKSITSFWKHEYDKHGTCAQSDERFSSELLYFENALKAYKSLPIAEAMSKFQGNPDEPIKADEMVEAIKAVIGGHEFQYHCLKDKKTGQTLLGDIRVCMNKDLTFRSCPDDKWMNRVASRIGRSMRGKRGPHPPPLPNFTECPTRFIYLKPDQGEDNTIIGKLWRTVKNIG